MHTLGVHGTEFVCLVFMLLRVYALTFPTTTAAAEISAIAIKVITALSLEVPLTESVVVRLIPPSTGSSMTIYSPSSGASGDT